ncbi:response regulator [Asticcacaulis excentricus]|uniref:Response regulator receiver protein n=1 Tax=Asticcacaulis excentricus (strain ATCC 15261 / DSM 4724 / KCTC 12464 / NCIMB 9791 / VKM B-1370 / CB 48) TaxID=573065 RepID=E8RL46_ASTEC|nr:response regulator receiver protein [Asticcacaulis excentricus CB 48]
MMVPAFDDQFTLVMIEDDAGHARLIRKNLERAGIGNPVRHFEDGAAAIDYFFGEHLSAAQTAERHERTLVLLDLNIPHIDGYEILRRLKGDPSTRAIPVIVLTTTDNPREIDRCYEMGCNVYITKPVEYDNFSDAIRKLGLMLAVVKVPNTVVK